MHKLPVFATAAHAYRFLVREAGTIIRLTWFPLLLVAVIYYLDQQLFYSAMRSLFGGDTNAGHAIYSGALGFFC